MKKIICTFLAIIMVMSLVACKGPETPAVTSPVEESTPVVTEPVVTEPPVEETEAPTEPRVEPTDFEAVDPATLPDPIPVEEQLLSEDTQTVTLGSLEEYEDLLWSLGFKEVRLAGTHQVPNVRDFGKDVTAYASPVSLTYNQNAFRFNFTYCMENSNGEMRQEENWFIYGTKSQHLANVSALSGEEFIPSEDTHVSHVGGTLEDALAAMGYESLSDVKDWSVFINNMNTMDATDEETSSNPKYEEKDINLTSRNNPQNSYYMKAVYYPVTGNLYNYMCSPNNTGHTATNVTINPDGSVSDTPTGMNLVGLSAQYMCFHYLFPEE